MLDREIAEQIARDASCAQGEFHQRVNAIIPYLDEIRYLRSALQAIDDIAVAKRRGAAGEMQKIARSALRRG